jgi:hypothetical protein
MSGSTQGPLATRLKVPKGRKAARKMVEDVINRIKTEQSLLPGDRLSLLDLATKQKTQLEQHGQTNKQKIAAIQAATTELEQIGGRINAALAIRGDAFATFNKARDEQEKNIFTALRKEAEQAGIRPDEVPILKEWSDLVSNAARGIGAAQDAQSANRIASEFEITSVQIAGRAGTSRGKIGSDMQAAKKLAEDKQAFKTLMQGIAKDLDKLEVLTGNIDQDSLTRAQEKDLNTRYGANGKDSITEGLELAKRLRTSVDQQLQRAAQAGENALGPLKVRFEKTQVIANKLKEVKTRSLGEESGFDIDLPYLGLTHYWPLVDDKVALIQRCFDENMPASGAPFIESQLDEFDKMLDEVRNFHKGDDAKLSEAIDGVTDLVQRKRYLFFDTDLQKYCPEDAKVLNVQFNSIDKDCKAMKPLEILKHLEDMKAAAETANKRAAALKKLCEVDAAGKLKEADKELEAIVKELAKLPEDVRDGHKTFHGDYRRSRDELSAALKFGAEGPDENKIRTLIARLATQLADIKPGGKLDPAAIGKSHTDGCKSEADEKQKKEAVKLKKKAVKLLYTEVEGIVDKSNPGDDAELKAIKRLLKEVDETADGLPPDKALERYEAVETRLNKLKANPAGMAVRARGELPNDYKGFTEGLAAAENDLRAFATVVSQDYNGDGKDALVNLINHSIDVLKLPAATIKKATDEFARNMAPEQMPGRLKARETGLSGVRQYKKLLEDDAVLASLAGASVFGNTGIGKLRGALNSLELNLLRGI